MIKHAPMWWPTGRRYFSLWRMRVLGSFAFLLFSSDLNGSEFLTFELEIDGYQYKIQPGPRKSVNFEVPSAWVPQPNYFHIMPHEIGEGIGVLTSFQWSRRTRDWLQP